MCELKASRMESMNELTKRVITLQYGPGVKDAMATSGGGKERGEVARKRWAI